MIDCLIKLADMLDTSGRAIAADRVDNLINKLAQITEWVIVGEKEVFNQPYDVYERTLGDGKKQQIAVPKGQKPNEAQTANTSTGIVKQPEHVDATQVSSAPANQVPKAPAAFDTLNNALK